MSTLSAHPEPPRARGGCPPVLTADISHNDIVEPPVEWPPAPPTRRDRHASTRPSDHVIDITDDDVAPETPKEGQVAQLTAGRALRLLTASVDHMRTVLETSPDASTCARVERAIGDVDHAIEALRELADDPAGDKA